MRTHSRDWWAFPRLHAVRTVPRAAVPGVSSDLPARTPVYRGMDDAAKTAACGFHFDSNKHVRRAAGHPRASERPVGPPGRAPCAGPSRVAEGAARRRSGQAAPARLPPWSRPTGPLAWPRQDDVPPGATRPLARTHCGAAGTRSVASGRAVQEKKKCGSHFWVNRFWPEWLYHTT